MSESHDPSQIVAEHRSQSPRAVRCAVITVSDTRTTETDRGGETIVELLQAGGHQVVSRTIVRDEADQVRAATDRAAVHDGAQVVLLTGGTGLSARDKTYETISAMLTRELPGYGELFRTLSFAEIGSAAMLSRAVGGLIGRVVVLTMPGSPAGVRLAMEKLILPELGHLVREAER